MFYYASGRLSQCLSPVNSLTPDQRRDAIKQHDEGEERFADMAIAHRERHAKRCY
jgi:hypothetical protein